ncbi:flagellar motor protein MotB [Paenibacillus sp. UMB4589-SE434]|uniref:flagellar motor protein MotB n=1 Tax=Paenibacillus sp. UMB4589-SE434 TaxID=3046314 RepID=UPI00254D54A8|nr:flagellar motor protein MotB [Paenibacillus sp. UMB4589-SE434]MDK8181660.1 flagellar motor protein MotB [Paenibacillus sp. UMB4589-SE434]
MRRKSRTRRGQSAENHERWLITYSDLITLLLIFFVVMYAMSQVDLVKYESLSETLQTTFRSGDGQLPKGSGILDGAYTKPGQTGAINTKKDGATGDQINAKMNKMQANAAQDADPNKQAVMIGQITEKDLAFRKQEEMLQQTMSVIQQYIEDNKLHDALSVTDTPKGIEIRLSDRLLFSLGRAELTSLATPTLDKLASLFSKLNTTISIEGHTDNLKMASGGRFKDNWALSAERALSVLRFFVDEKNLDSAQFQIAGYGDTRPVASNDSDTGRQKNRRVEIIILRNVVQPST